jgi:nickel/cobalt exporter
MNRRRLWAPLVLAGLGVLLTPAAATAHPLGNFTTNQYAGVRVTAGGVDVDYVLDLAELPAYQATHEEIDTDGDGAADQSERDRYATATCSAAGAATGVTIDGRTATVTARPVGLTFPPGAGGLTTLRLGCALHADGRPADGSTIGVHAGYLADRIGWREITAVGDRYTLTRSTVPASSASARLTAYPPGAPTADIRSAEITVRPGGPAAAPFDGEHAGPGSQAGAAPDRGADRLTRWFTDLVGHPTLTWGVGILAVLVALVLGGAHAVAPGHGKTIMAAYLVGGRGRMAQALTVAATVAVTHTAGVLVLGVVLATSLQLAPDDLYAWLRLASGVLVAGVGAHLLRRALLATRARTAALTTHSHGAHSHDPHAHGAHAHGSHSHDGHSHSIDSRSQDTHGDHSYAGHGHPLAHAPHSAAEHSHSGTGLAAAPATGLALAGHPHPDHDHSGHPHPDHDHSGHPHPDHHAGEPHSHGGGRPHTHHLPAPDEPFRVRTLLAMGFAGGLSPSPSAVVVLLGAAALGRAWYGVLLVVAYGVGLAAVLTGIGLALARWGERLRSVGSGRFARLLTHRLPTVTAAAILAVGVGMAAVAVTGLLGPNG